MIALLLNGNSSAQAPCIVPPASPKLKFHSSENENNHKKKKKTLYILGFNSLPTMRATLAEEDEWLSDVLFISSLNVIRASVI